MSLHIVDISIIIGYVILVLLAGFYASSKANQSMESYFVGNKEMKWYMLGLSNSSGMFDINAVSWRLAMLIIYGVQSVWIPWVWPIWNQVFVMIFLSTWLRRSEALTGAEWMRLRFGDGLGGKLSHLIVVVFAVIEVMLSIGMFFTGIGGLLAELLPSISLIGLSSEFSYATIICVLTMLYSIKGGIHSIVATEVLQFFIMIVCCVLVLYLGMTTVEAEKVAQFLPHGWLDFWPQKEIAYTWPVSYEIIESETVNNGFKMIAGMVGLMLVKGMIASLAGPVPGFDMQRSLSSQSPKDAAKMSGFTILVLFIPLYMMIGGFALMAIEAIPTSLNGLSKVEQIFNVIVKQLPVGLKGIILVSLLSAFMSTFSAFVNVGPAYLINDIYKRYFVPSASTQHYITAGRLASVIIVVIGIIVGTLFSSLNEIILFITGAFYGGYAAPNALKWVWSRFNGYGYFAGMLAGMFSAMVGGKVVKYLVQDIPSLAAMADTQALTLMSFVFIFIVSIVTCIVVTLLTPPVETATTEHFYRKTRPWGFWKSVYQKMQKTEKIKPNSNFKRDAFNVIIGIVWQMSMVVLPLFVAFRQWSNAGIALATLFIGSIILKFNWYDQLEEN
jgi:solute:Na+ symporter, SSS family